MCAFCGHTCALACDVWQSQLHEHTVEVRVCESTHVCMYIPHDDDHDDVHDDDHDDERVMIMLSQTYTHIVHNLAKHMIRTFTSARKACNA